MKLSLILDSDLDIYYKQFNHTLRRLCRFCTLFFFCKDFVVSNRHNDYFDKNIISQSIKKVHNIRSIDFVRKIDSRSC